MKKLNFILKDNENVLIEKSVEYFVENDYISFNLENSMFKINFQDFHFLKETSEDVFEIEVRNEIATAVYTLKEIGLTFDVKVMDFSYSFINNIHVIKYNIESDPESIKEIILTLNK